MSWNHMTSHVIDLIKSGQFYIINHPEVDFLLIIHYLIYLTFLINLSNQLFESTYTINFLIELAAPRAYDTLLPQMYICRNVYSYLLSYV